MSKAMLQLQKAKSPTMIANNVAAMLIRNPVPLIHARFITTNNIRHLGYEISRHETPPETHSKVKVHGKGSLAVCFGGFGFGKKQMKKHLELYERHQFDTMPIFSSIPQLTQPSLGKKRAKVFAEQIMKENKPVILHSVSGAFWTVLFTLNYMDKEWREKNVRAIAFDSSPPKIGASAFGGWLAFFLHGISKGNIPAHVVKPLATPIFLPYIWYAGITSDFIKENDERMFNSDVIPSSCHCLFMHGRNDPVLDTNYVTKYSAKLKEKANPGVFVTELLFDRARHAMTIVDHPDVYKQTHLDLLLKQVPEWRKEI